MCAACWVPGDDGCRKLGAGRFGLLEARCWAMCAGRKGIAAFEVLVPDLNLLTYYSLVLFSLTGLSSLLGATITIAAEEDMAGIIITTDITHYLGTTVIVRRFKYHFLLPGIRVKMWHLLADGKLTLLEIYQPLDQLYAMGAVAFTAAACAYAYA
mmetsp:Transcript_14829/g.33352  ORF Transcript_14829/g.33352 Transcript_14829/m.33352 type:complete len:155 (+) Transcript_14829:390-854(+)